MSNLKLALGAAIAMAVATPAQAQYPAYPGYPGGIAGDIQRGAQAAADAVTGIAYALRGARESFGVGACRVRAAQLGRAQITEVRPKGRRSLRVRGYIEPVAAYGAWGSRYDYADRPRSFTCTVRDDGSISKFKTKRLRRG